MGLISGELKRDLQARKYSKKQILQRIFGVPMCVTDSTVDDDVDGLRLRL
jgi:hypothetical protein